MIKEIQKNKVFKLFSSVKMAVPLMLILGGVVAAGTLYESRYNADVANIFIYKSWWFQFLLGLLWINIFCATLSRIPFKKHHFGFVITHIGLLTLLIGAQVTATSGIDGQLRVAEHESGNTVFLPKNVIKVFSTESAPVRSVSLARKFDKRSGEDLGLSEFTLQNGISIDQYVPFAKRTGAASGADEGSKLAGEVNLGFRLQSQFFDVSQTLNTENRSELQMGPATLRLVKGAGSKKIKSEKPLQSSSTNRGTGSLTVLDANSSAVIQTISLSALKKGAVKVRGVELKLVQVYSSAMVDGKKLHEQGGHQNPAIEFMVKSGSESVREISYEKFPNFSLRKTNTLGLSFRYESGGSSEVAQASESSSIERSVPQGGNTIEFFVTPGASDTVQVRLSKMGKVVLEKKAKMNEEIVTPWMGMKITILSVSDGGASSSVKENPDADKITEVEMIPKMPLPSSAIYVRPVGGDLSSGHWLLEGDSAKVQTRSGEVEVYYGMDSIELPFKLKLEKFEKVNYPGTDTAMSFQSAVRINENGSLLNIKMNEPLEEMGFTLYQSSFEQGDGVQTASIFSVNHDPGRFLKYVGAIILSIGIVIFTLMRSKWYAQLEARLKFNVAK